MRECRAEYLILPVGSVAQNRGVEQRVVDLYRGIHIGYLFLETGILRQVHHLDFSALLLPCGIAVVVELHLPLFAAARGYYHYAVGAGRTVYGRCRGILQHVHRHDVRRSDRREGVDLGLTARAACPVEAADIVAVARERYAVDHVQRLVGRGNRRGAAHADRGRTARSARVLRYLHAGHASLQHLVGIGYGRCFQLLGRDRCDRTGQVGALLHAVTDHDHLVDRLALFGQSHVHDGHALVDLSGLVPVTEERVHERRLAGRAYRNRVRAVDVGRHAVAGTLLTDADTRHGLPVGGRCHRAADAITLSHRGYAQKERNHR